jgi:PAS domain S-box-containing protein
MLVRSAAGEEHLRLLRELRITSYICVPLVVHQRMFGALTLVYAESGRHYTDDDLALAQDLALRAATAVENAQLYRDAERERARFASIVASVSVGVYQLDDRGRIIYLNPAAPALLQTDQAALLGRDPHEAIRHRLLDGSPCAARTCPLRRAVTDTVPHTGMVSLVLRDRSSRELEVTISPVVVRGAPSGAVVVFQDVTERLLQARMRDDFLAFASHELRSPLTTLSGFAKWLEKRTKTLTGVLDPESMEAIQTISTEADRMVNIVELFLDLTRIESNRLTLALEPVDFRAVVLGEVEAAAARHREIRIARELRDEPLPGVSDVNRLRQVLTNLLDNAAVYGAGYADPDVRVRLARVEEGVRVSVWNAGPGIAPEDQQHIFDRFYRGRAGEARKRGIGIGLFISRQIAERLGGTLTFESSPEQGTEFVLSLPLPSGSGRGAHGTGDGDAGFAER